MTQLALFAATLTKCPCCDQIPRAVQCHPCKTGHHIDHLAGIRDYANPTITRDPIICTCPTCVR